MAEKVAQVGTVRHRKGVAIPTLRRLPEGVVMAHLRVVAGAAVGRVSGIFRGWLRGGWRGSGKLKNWIPENLNLCFVAGV